MEATFTMTHHTVTLPDGTIATRNSASHNYSHVVLIRVRGGHYDSSRYIPDPAGRIDRWTRKIWKVPVFVPSGTPDVWQAAAWSASEANARKEAASGRWKTQAIAEVCVVPVASAVTR